MKSMRALVAVLGVSVSAIVGCGSPQESAASAPAAKEVKTTYICHMGADCGKADVAAGEKVPSCCGKVMVKADTYSCSCGKTKIIAAGKPAPECCGAAMKKATP